MGTRAGLLVHEHECHHGTSVGTVVEAHSYDGPTVVRGSGQQWLDGPLPYGGPAAEHGPEGGGVLPL
jgi:hypothetical protein